MAAKLSQTQGIHGLYELHCGLGSGAFATVVKALHKTEKRWYAIKSFPGDKLQEFVTRRSGVTDLMESTAKHLKREIGVLRNLRHRNICQLKEAFIDSGYSVSK